VSRWRQVGIVLLAAGFGLPWLALDAAAADATRLWSQATAQMRVGRVKSAVRVLEDLSRVSSRDPAVWTALGQARMRVEDFTGAASAFDEALIREPDSPKALFGIGEAYAAQGEAERAFLWLQRARDSRRFDMTEMTSNPHFGAVRADARWRSLLPEMRDFDQPFVEPVNIIREWRGEAPEDQFGWIARNIGDVDADGIADVVVSAPTHGNNGNKAGRIYVYSAGRGMLLWSADGEPGDQLGSGLEGVGDTNGDGIPDVAASGPEGRVAHIYSGRDGQVLHTFRAARKDEIFGNHISAAGDVDGDGFQDVIVGAPGGPEDKANPGHAYVYSGKDGSLLLTLAGQRAGDGFGSAVAGSSRNGARLLVVGAPGAGISHHGRVYVYSGSVARPAFIFDADGTGNALGAMFVAIPGDVDGDGTPDIFASDWSNEAAGPSTGRIYVYSGRTGQRLFAVSGENRGDGFGTSASVAGDVDGDGHADLIVGAWQYGKVVTGGGRSYLYGGKDGRLLATFTCRVPGDTFGFDAVGLGDVDHDGIDDLLITSGWSAVNGHHSGRVFVISSGIERAQH